MHESIRENLEDYLRGSAGRVPQEFQAHLASCRSCADEVERLESQARMLRSLQAAEEVEPRAGFYARVMDRIEHEQQESIWSILLQPSFGRRLAVASAALVLAMGAYLVTTELSEPMVAQAPAAITMQASAPEVAVADASSPDAGADAAQQQRRDALLVNLASFRQ